MVFLPLLLIFSGFGLQSYFHHKSFVATDGVITSKQCDQHGVVTYIYKAGGDWFRDTKPTEVDCEKTSVGQHLTVYFDTKFVGDSTLVMERYDVVYFVGAAMLPAALIAGIFAFALTQRSGRIAKPRFPEVD